MDVSFPPSLPYDLLYNYNPLLLPPSLSLSPPPPPFPVPWLLLLLFHVAPVLLCGDENCSSDHHSAAQTVPTTDNKLFFYLFFFYLFWCFVELFFHLPPPPPSLTLNERLLCHIPYLHTGALPCLVWSGSLCTFSKGPLFSFSPLGHSYFSSSLPSPLTASASLPSLSLLPPAHLLLTASPTVEGSSVWR
jgi:hypothetical protein